MTVRVVSNIPVHRYSHIHCSLLSFNDVGVETLWLRKPAGGSDDNRHTHTLLNHLQVGKSELLRLMSVMSQHNQSPVGVTTHLIHCVGHVFKLHSALWVFHFSRFSYMDTSLLILSNA